MLNTRLVSEIIRQRTGSKDDGLAARAVNGIPECLKRTARIIVADPALRELLITDKTTTSIAIANGAANLVTGYSTWQFLLEWFDQGQCYLAPAVSISSVDTSVDTLTIADSLPAFASLDRVQFSGPGLPSPLVAVTNYYLTGYNPRTGAFGLSTTSNGLTPVNLLTAGSGTIMMTKMDATGQPMQRLRNPQQAALPNYLTNVFSYFYIQGNSLFVLPASTAGSVKFAVPYFPTTLATLPSSTEAERIFLQEMMNYLEMPAVDSADEGRAS